MFVVCSVKWRRQMQIPADVYCSFNAHKEMHVCVQCTASKHECMSTINFKCCRNNWTKLSLSLSPSLPAFPLPYSSFVKRECKIIMIKWKFVACVIIGFPNDIPGHYEWVSTHTHIFSSLLPSHKSAHNYDDDDYKCIAWRFHAKMSGKKESCCIFFCAWIGLFGWE